MSEKQKRLTILMIEVEQPEGLTARKLVAETMKHNVITAYSGEEGLDLFRRNSCDVVLVHSRLAGMDAAEVIRVVREEEPEVPVLVVAPEDTDGEAGRRLGANATVRPHHVEDLVDFLNEASLKILEQHPAERPMTETRSV